MKNKKRARALKAPKSAKRTLKQSKAKKQFARPRQKIILQKTWIEGVEFQPERKTAVMPFFMAVLIAGILAGGALSLFFPLEATDAPITGQVIRIEANNEKIAEVENELPFEAVHWHARVRIFAAGSLVGIPAQVGIARGNNIDNNVSGAKASPIHTHERDNVLHIENVAPRLYKEQMRLGYFFEKAWGKKFSRECILEYCNGPGGEVKMFVNGRPNEEFEKYSLRDGEEIIITYELPRTRR